MLSYQHIYHAGNFADVQKHVILCHVLKSLAQKPGALAVIDTHAGRGLYDLSGEEAQKNREFENGVSHFLNLSDTAFQTWAEIVKKYNNDGISRYPGSTLIAHSLLRPADRLICCEMHPGEFTELQKNTVGLEKIQAHKNEGMKILLQNTPPVERRGLAIIDPSYEIKTEYDDLPRQILNIWKKWPQGCFFIWYPIMDTGGHKRLLNGLRQSGMTDILISEVRLHEPPKDDYRMTGSGIAIINPPWREKTLDAVTQALAQNMPEKAFGETFWLDNAKIDPDTGRIV